VATTVEHEDSRSRALGGRIARLEYDPGPLDAVALGLVDAALAGDAGTLGVALAALRDARTRAGDREPLRGWLDAAIGFAYWSLERAPAPGVARDTHAHAFLAALEVSDELGSAELRRRLETDETEVSRTGRRLLDGGLVTRRKAGRQVFWQLSPRGRRALEDAVEAAPPDSASFWREAIRRGFEGAARDADPTRERIVECTLELHKSKGIRATTWQDIAARADVSVEEVQALFPTLDELERACGQHFLESLRLPPPERAAEVFASDSSEEERVHRLVETSFEVYERGADGITVGRRERAEVAAARESMEAIDSSLDALVTEALLPRRLDAADVASLRALTDLEVWRALRDQGDTPQAAVEHASAAVERWLEGHPV
jgi:AcrR family transcriptional regulator/DNA-binding transcriptional ArsR family regulator